MKETWCALSFVYTDSTAALHRAMVNTFFIGLVNILSPLVLIMINQDHRQIVLVMTINIMIKIVKIVFVMINHHVILVMIIDIMIKIVTISSCHDQSPYHRCHDKGTHRWQACATGQSTTEN